MKYDARVVWLLSVSLVCGGFAVTGFPAVAGVLVLPSFTSIVRLLFRIRRSHDEVKYTLDEDDEFDIDPSPLELVSKKKVYLTVLGHIFMCIGVAPLLFIRPYRSIELPSTLPLVVAALAPLVWIGSGLIKP